MQQVFVKLLVSRRQPDEPRAWLFRCVRNESLSLRRTLRRRLVREQSIAACESIFDESIDVRLDAKIAQSALHDLPPRQREIVVLRIWSGLTLAEVSAVTGVPVSTVHDQFTAAMAAMRTRMEPNAKVRNR